MTKEEKNAQRRAYYWENRDKELARGREYRLKTSLRRNAEHRKKYAEDSSLREKKKEYYQKNKERIRAYQMEYQKMCRESALNK